MDLQLGRKYNAFFSKNLRDLDQENTKSAAPQKVDTERWKTDGK